VIGTQPLTSEAPQLDAGFERITSCTLCGSAPLRQNTATAVRCCRCRLTMISPRPSLALITQHYSRKGQYDSWLNELPDRTPLWERRLTILRRFASGGTLLDVGAGIGEFIARASRLFDCVGVEPSVEAVELARPYLGVALRHGLLEDLPHRPGSFDVITLWHVLEHVPSPGSTLARCCQLLRLGGHLVIAVPNASRLHWRGLWQEGGKNPIRRLATALGGAQRSYYQPYPAIKLVLGEEIHLSHFTQRTLLGHLRMLGCGVRYIGPDLCVTKCSKLCKGRFDAARFLTAVVGYNPFETMLIIVRRDNHLQRQQTENGKSRRSTAWWVKPYSLRRRRHWWVSQKSSWNSKTATRTFCSNSG